MEHGRIHQLTNAHRNIEYEDIQRSAMKVAALTVRTERITIESTVGTNGRDVTEAPKNDMERTRTRTSAKTMRKMDLA